MALLEVDGHRDASVIRETLCKTLFHNDLWMRRDASFRTVALAGWRVVLSIAEP